MSRAAALMALALEAGGLMLFWALEASGWGRYAPAAVAVFVVGDGLRRFRASLGFPRVWRLFNGLALALAVLDVVAAGRVWAPLEGVVADVLIAAVFLTGSMGRKPLVQEIAEQRQGMPFRPERRDLLTFFRAYTLVWAGYFLLRAGLWLWLLHDLPLEQARLLQGVIGPISLLAMIIVSFRGAALFRQLRRFGMFRT